MRFAELQLMAYGCFTGRCLRFDAGAGFHVIAGPNEAGKSTLLRALSGLLYGIPARSADCFLHPARDLRIGAELERSDGQRLQCVRRKGNRDTLLDLAGKPISEQLLTDFLGTATEEVFGTIYRLDHLSLVRGGDDLLAGKGDLAQSLFQAGTGITNLRHVLQQLDAEADKLFKRAGQNPLLNQAVAAFEEARKRLRDATVVPRVWAAKAEELKEKEADLAKLKENISGLSGRKERLARVQLALPHLTRRTQLLHELETLGPVVLLPETASRQREEVERQRRVAEIQKQRTEDKRRELLQELSGLELPTDLLLQSDPITRLCERVEIYRQAIRDVPRIQNEQGQFEAAARARLAEIRPGLTLAQAGDLRLTAVQRTRIQRLALSHAALDERRQSTRRKAENIAREHRDKQQSLAALCPVPELASFERCLAQVRKQGDLEARLRTELANRQRLQGQADVALKRLPAWSGTLVQLEALPVPLAETIDQFAAERNLLDNEQQVLLAQGVDNSSLVRTREAEIEALRLGGAVPTEEGLAEVREHRERGWRLIRRAWLEGQPDPAAQAAYDSAQPLPEAYEQSVLAADALADRLRREADRVARLASLVADKQAGDHKADDLTHRQAQLDLRLNTWTQSWRAIWIPAAITPLSPLEMQGWLNRHASLLAQAAELRVCTEKAAQIAEQIQEARAELATALQAFEETGSAVGSGESPPATALPGPGAVPSSTESLTACLDRAQACLDRLQQTARDRTAGEKELQKLQRDSAAAERDRLQAQEHLEAWAADWQQAIAPLGLSADTRAEEGAAVLERIDALFRNIDDSLNRRARVEDMQQCVEQFTASVAHLVQQLRPDLAALPPDQAATRLQALLAQAQQQKVLRDQLEQQIKALQQTSQAAETDLARTDLELKALMDQAGCADLQTLQAAEAKSTHARQLAQQLAEVDRALTGFAGGATLEVFLPELALTDADQLPFLLAELGKEIGRLDDQRSLLEQDVGSQKTLLRASDESETAFLAAEESQAALAAVRSHAEEYLRVRLAGEVLRRHIERYREQNQDPVIQRASEIFPRLTLHSFTRLRTSFDDKDRPILVGVRPSGEEVEVSGMSDGTRDQLFLSLRLASLDRQLSSGEPFPFVLDDILLNFDDARARATLEQLADVARRTQVLFFTHHARLVELAQAAVSADLLQVHQLE